MSTAAAVVLPSAVLSSSADVDGVARGIVDGTLAAFLFGPVTRCFMARGVSSRCVRPSDGGRRS
jgi:hypothetical protein